MSDLISTNASVNVNSSLIYEQEPDLSFPELLFENILPCPIDDHQTVGIILFQPNNN
jgi:hypothetical protein